MGELSALLQKNFIIWKRNKGSLFAEFFVAIAFASIFWLFNYYSPRETNPDKRYLSAADPMTPLASMTGQPFPKDYVALRNYLLQRFVQTNFTSNWLMKDCTIMRDAKRKTGGYIALSPPGLPIVSSLEKFFNETFGYRVLYFKDQNAIQDYVKAEHYGNPNVTDPGWNMSICMGVSFTNTTSGNWRYSVHYNTTGNPSWYDLMDLGQPQIIKFQQEIPMDYHWKNQINSGLSVLQELIANLILQQESQVQGGYIASQVAMAPVKNYKSSKLYQNTNSGDLSFFIVFPLMINFLKFVYNLVNEKEKRITENLRNMGMSMYKHYASWIIFNTGVLFVVTMVWAILAKFMLFTHSNFLFVWLLIFLPGLMMQSVGVFVSSFFIKAKSAIICGIVFMFIFNLARSAAQSIQNPPDSLMRMLAISPTHAIALTGGIMVQTESFADGFGFDDLKTNVGGISYLDFLTVQFLSAIVFVILGLYLDQVWPSEIGQKRHPLFFILDWCPSKPKAVQTESLLEGNEEEQTLNFEQIDAQLQAQSKDNKTLKIQNLRKVYSNGKVAVENLSLEMFTDQIFALLGHNGAGKTTTISMISGLLEQTSGVISLLGKDNREDAHSNRKILGVCPQTNPIYENLTCREHLVLYATIKSKDGVIPLEETEKEIDDILKDLDLYDKKDYPASKLSGGQKRKLCVACAFIGGSKVILLDEPTSGMDTYARRYLWEMLKSYKKDRIIILSTHYMDEADYLGDRIGIMGKGKLITCGSSLFLKKRFGVGYDLTVVKTAPEISTDRILDAVLQFVPSALKSGDISMETKFQLPTQESSKFEALFNHFEVNREQLGIQTFGISLTTLEEVFLKVATLEEQEEKEDMTEVLAKKDRIAETIADENFELNDIRIKDPVSIFFIHFWALCKKRFIYFKRDKRGLVCEIFLPIIIILAGMYLTTITFIKESPSGELLPSLLGKSSSVYYSTQSSNPTLDTYFKEVTGRQSGSSLTYLTSQDAASFESILLDTQQTSNNTNRFFSVFVNEFDTAAQKFNYTCFVNTTAPFSINLCINTMENVIYSAIRKDSASKISMDIVPLALTKQVAAFNNTAVGFIAAILVSIAYAFVPASLIVLLVKERENNVKHQQIVSGVSLFAYWLSNLVVDWVKFLIPAGATVLIFKIYDVDVFLNKEGLPVTMLMFFFFGPCLITFTYLFSFLFKSPSKAQFVIFLLNYFGGAILLIASFILRVIDKTRSVQVNLVEFILRLFPVYDIAFGLFSMANSVIWQIAFELPEKPGPWSRYCALWSVIYLAGLPVIYFGLIMLIEYKGQQVSQSFSSSGPAPEIAKAEEDEDVAAERTAVLNGDDYVVQVKNLIIEYVIFGKGFCQKKKPTSTKVAVKGVTFGVKKGECFGLLGTNGAGKTSTFKVLTGEVIPNRGAALIAGLDTKSDMKTIGSLIGYCPQFDALLENLTSREHLELYAAIKGIPANMREKLIENKLQQLNLKQYEHVQAGTYSGGNKRKLSVAMALLGNPPIILLDEPSSGMDPEARRFMWNIVSQISTQNKKSSVILTTHSMEEAEALSSKLAIMVEGRIKCIGPVQQLKSKYGKGFEIEAKIQLPETEEILRLRKQVSNPDDAIDTKAKAIQVLTSVGFNNAEFEFCPNGRCNHFAVQVVSLYCSSLREPTSYSTVS
jgi:ATP-binding cassette subfamily A (ABC1) protein 3